MAAGGDALSDSFIKFCSFGAGQAGAREMDGAKWAKFCKETNLIDKKLTRTEVDLIFTRVKGKTERKISFAQFQQGLRLAAGKKYPGDDEETAYSKAVALVTSGDGPVVRSNVGGLSGAAARSVERGTDVAGYTGAHKERFNEDGTGKGKSGRVTEAQNTGYVGAYKGDGTYDEPGAAADPKPKKASTRADDITSRLTDSSKYTGAHKERFGADGGGKGRSGRVDESSNSGYVGGYKNSGTYGK